MTLKYLPLLEVLNLSRTYALTRTHAPPLHEFQALISVKCINDKITDHHVLALSRISNLREVDVSYSLEVTDVSLKSLGVLPSLEKVAVAWTSITNEGIAYLTSTNLQNLNVSRNLLITDGCLPHLRALKSLKMLRCWKTKTWTPIL